VITIGKHVQGRIRPGCKGKITDGTGEHQKTTSLYYHTIPRLAISRRGYGISLPEKVLLQTL